MVAVIQNLICKACSGFEASRPSESSGKIAFAVEAILQAKHLNPSELGMHRQWLVYVLKVGGSQLVSSEKAEKVRSILVPDYIESWEERFIKMALSDPAPLNMMDLIEAVTVFKLSKQIRGYLSQFPIRFLRYAVQAEAHALIDGFLKEYLNNQNRRWKCELLADGGDLHLLLRKGILGYIARELIRGVAYFSWKNADANSYYFLRWLPDSVRQGLNTIYLDTSEIPIQELLSDIKNVLPIRRVVLKPLNTYSDWQIEWESCLEQMLNELPGIQEVVFCGKGGFPKFDRNLSYALKERLRGMAVELDDAVVEDAEWRQFFGELFHFNPTQLDWSQPISKRYEPAGWMAPKRTPLVLDFQLLPEAKHSSLVCALAPELVKEVETNKELPLRLLQASGIISVDSHTILSFNIEIACNKLIGPKVLEWTETLWRNNQLHNSTCRSVIKWWAGCADTAPFKQCEILTKEKMKVWLPAFPLRVARGQRKGELPDNVSCSFNGARILGLFLDMSLKDFEFSRLTPDEFIACAEAAAELQVNTFWLKDFCLESGKWTDEQVRKLKEIAINAKAEQWFSNLVKSMVRADSSFSHPLFLNADTIRDVQKSSWWPEIKLLSSGLSIDGNPVSVCQEIFSDPAPFREVKQLLWNDPNLDQQWAVKLLIEKLPNLQQVTLKFTPYRNVPPITLSSLSLIQELDPTIQVVLCNATLSTEDTVPIGKYGKRTREVASVELENVRFVSTEGAEKIDLTQIPSILEGKKVKSDL